MSAEQALKHEWFRSSPKLKHVASMPVFKADNVCVGNVKDGNGKVAMKTSKKKSGLF
jgi:hypothetical protein